MFGSTGGLQDEMLRAFIDRTFQEFDTDKSGTLDENEMNNFFNTIFRKMNLNQQVTKEQTLLAIRSIDKNFDGKVDKQQLFEAFKIMYQNAQQQQFARQQQIARQQQYLRQQEMARQRMMQAQMYPLPPPYGYGQPYQQPYGYGYDPNMGQSSPFYPQNPPSQVYGRPGAPYQNGQPNMCNSHGYYNQTQSNRF